MLWQLPPSQWNEKRPRQELTTPRLASADADERAGDGEVKGGRRPLALVDDCLPWMTMVC
jgi:hypothetical protein